MKIYYDKRFSKQNLALGVRPHPYDSALYDENVKYYDFIQNPQLVRSVLEDFVPYNSESAIQSFYDLIEWLNGNDSYFESNDTAFQFGENITETISQKLEARGRIMFFLRDKILNFNDKIKLEVEEKLWNEIAEIDSDFDLGFIGFSHSATKFTELMPPFNLRQVNTPAVYFWAWGNTKEETFGNLDRLIQNLNTAFQRTNNSL